MSILSEAVQVTLHDQLVEIRYSSVVNNAGGVHDGNAILWLERANLPWLRDALESVIADEFAAPATMSRGGDNLRVLIGGHEAEPYVNLFNKRADGLERCGTFWIALSRRLTPTLLANIKSLAP